MNYTKLYQTTKPVKVGLIGTGAFGKSFLFQARLSSKIEIPIVCDREAEIARQACLRAGLAETQLVICATQTEIQTTLATGKTAIVEDARFMMDTSIDVVVESTGIPEAGATHGKLALEHGKHVVMVNKETDSVVGPILTKMAAEANLVYSPADGDQPSLLIGLLQWASTIGLEPVCGGKASVPDFVYNATEQKINKGQQTVNLSGSESWDLWEIPAGRAEEVIKQRSEMLQEIPRILVPDLCEMAIVINSTGFGCDTPTLHAPVVRMIEMPQIFCDNEAGGILKTEGVIDVVHCLRRRDEAGLAGGVFIVVKCEDKTTWRLLKGKGHLMNRAENRALIYRPYHLLGLETTTTILSISALNLSTGGTVVKPKVDLCAKTIRPLQAGQKLGIIEDHAITGVTPLLLPATATAPANPVPFYLAAGNSLSRDVPPDTLLTYEMIDQPDSLLWQLKQLQDESFLSG